ncbi:hypothetical protein [Methylocystis rosea]|uniref:hypothetical protein n=1 Tax=Methylocystis rosea TaxID=173366 RepID=UPI0003A3FAAC|nr:hypothetical protein [Methylocystis rosea]
MGAVASAFTAAFVDASNVVKSTVRALGSTIETYVAAPRTHNANAAANPTSAPTGYVRRAIGANGADAGDAIDAFGGVPTGWLRRANGTGGTPTAISNGDIVGQWNFAGWYTSGGPAYATGASIRAEATQNWTSTAQGSKLVFSVAANGSATLVDKWTLDQDGSLKGVGAFGYATGAGGTVTQLTSKSTGVTLHKLCGQITMNAAALGSLGIASFVLTNSFIEAGDNLILNHVGGGANFGAYRLNGRCVAGSATIDVMNSTGGLLAEAIVIRFTVIKGVTA